MIKIIDPHLHLFDLNKGSYQWLRPENPPFWPDKHLIAKHFSEQDLTLSSPLSLSGFVHIEAGFDNEQSWREIAWLEETCKRPFRSIAMLDITLPKPLFSQQLEKLMHYQSVVGIRHILDDNAQVMLNNQHTGANLALLADKQLSFELQMPLANTSAVDSLITIIHSTTDLMLSINHAGSPTADKKQQIAWLDNLKRLAKFSTVFIKCSGYEMTDRYYSTNWQHKIIALCLENFGISRVMLASNFPLSLWHGSYQDTWLANTELPYNAVLIQQLCFSNAAQFYKF
jgi:predicted TIM-barrel fold metal-dependent hydrolase|tara:strand:- start:15812 stop:16666 length:855 start_codon:yes stop_codon:yes gene_type:complete